MTSEVRSFSDFQKFPGSYDDAKQTYEFPVISYIDSRGNTRLWQIFVRLVKTATKLSGIDWDITCEALVPIKPEYFLMGDSYLDLPRGTVAQIWVEVGIKGGKITRHAPTYVSKIKNVGKINQRHQLHNALIEARAKYLKKMETHSVVPESKTDNTPHFPMLAIDWKTGQKHIKYPCYIQPKLDGVRCIAYLRKYPGTVDDVILYSRNLKPYNHAHISQSLLKPLLELYDQCNNVSLFIDGELYAHGKSLQDISGVARRKTSSKTGKTSSNQIKLNYNVYDCFYPTELDATYEDRKNQLNEFFAAVDEYKLPYIHRVTTVLIYNETQAYNQYKKFLKLNYEGAIIRNIDGLYITSKTRRPTRGKSLIKMKPKMSDEYEIIGYDEGTKGKDKGAIIWILKTKEGKTFNATPKNMTYKKRYALFQDAQKRFDEKYLGRMMTIEYEDLSNDKIPMRAKSVAIRDYE